ncbi:MAG: hypothetical protein ABL928_14135, partial [Sphingorhabdus sp.]
RKYQILCRHSIIYLSPRRFLAVSLSLKLPQQSPGNHRNSYHETFRTAVRLTSKPSGSSNSENPHA